MNKYFITVTCLLMVSQASFAAPTKEQYAARVRAEKLLRAEIAGDGSKMTGEQAKEFGDQIIQSLKTINANQLKKGMTCPEIKEFVDATIGKKIQESGTEGVMYQAGKYIEADCAIQKSWST